MKKTTWGRKLADTFVKKGTRRLIELKDGKNVTGWIFIAVNKEGNVSVHIKEKDWEQWEKMKSNPFKHFTETDLKHSLMLNKRS